jgi:hypothetical protein
MPPATAGWQQRAGKPQPQIPFTNLSPDSFFSSLPTFDEKTTKLHLHAEKLTEILLHLNLGHFVGFFLCMCSFVLLYASPLMRQIQTTSEAPSPGLETEMDIKIIKTETSLHLNLEGFFFIYYFSFCFILFIYTYISFIYLFFIFILIFILFIFYFQSSLFLCNACSAYCRLVH